MVGKWRSLMGGRLVDVSPLRCHHEIFFGLFGETAATWQGASWSEKELRAVILCNDGSLSSLDRLYQAHNSF